jgi:hypothetical protein
MNIALPFDWTDTDEPVPLAHGPSWTALPPPEQLLIWSMRHMLLCWPSCGSVKSALHAAYDDDALGVEHLLRCLLAGVGAFATRSLAVGDPTCAPLLADEGALLYILRAAPVDPTAAGGALAELCGSPRAAVLLPLAASLATAAGLRTGVDAV